MSKKVSINVLKMRVRAKSKNPRPEDVALLYAPLKGANGGTQRMPPTLSPFVFSVKI